MQERSPDAVQSLPTAQTKTKSAAEVAAEEAERLAQAAAEAAAAAARAAAEAAEQAAQAAVQAEEKRAAAAALAASAVRVEDIDRCGDCRVLRLTLLWPHGSIPTHYCCVCVRGRVQASNFFLCADHVCSCERAHVCLAVDAHFESHATTVAWLLLVSTPAC